MPVPVPHTMKTLCLLLLVTLLSGCISIHKEAKAPLEADHACELAQR